MSGRSTNKRKQYEQTLIRLFNAHGYEGMRSVASLGCADVFVYSNYDARLIQVKTSKSPVTTNSNVSLLATALQNLCEAPEHPEIRKQLWFKQLRYDWIFLEIDCGPGKLSRKSALTIVKNDKLWLHPPKGEVEADVTTYGWLGDLSSGRQQSRK